METSQPGKPVPTEVVSVIISYLPVEEVFATVLLRVHSTFNTAVAALLTPQTFKDLWLKAGWLSENPQREDVSGILQVTSLHFGEVQHHESDESFLVKPSPFEIIPQDSGKVDEIVAQVDNMLKVPHKSADTVNFRQIWLCLKHLFLLQASKVVIKTKDPPRGPRLFGMCVDTTVLTATWKDNCTPATDKDDDTKLEVQFEATSYYGNEAMYALGWM
eukprot:TRINITY_DN48261_c0_g1_i1.p1 TRINITY_DN48261_c0_g1~~TRINITY_DN48261_c0_g1_i1.p1  ORF type:complete len:234 (+),score=2.37 TRINITY_DN48261_c0_g1_i1:54-704(+)